MAGVTRSARQLGVLLLLLLLTLAFTWPLGDLRHPRLPAHDDALFSVWRLAWIAHQLQTDPGDLFNANIFWPEQNTLAFSDAILLLGFAGAPLIWLGAHPVTVHNVLLLASFVAAGYGAMRLLRYLGVNTAAQFVGAIIFAFAPYRIAHLGHLELLWTAFLPLSLLGLYRVLEAPRFGRGLMLGVTLAVQGFCSIYYAVFLAIWMVPAALVARWHLTFAWSRRHLVAGAVTVITAAVLLGPYALAYWNARQQVGSRAEAEIQRYSAVALDYLNVPPANRAYEARPSESPDERSLFLGSIALGLAAASVVDSRRRRTALAFVALAAVAFDLSLGVNGVSYNVLRFAIPALDGFRAPARFAVLVLLSVSVLGGLAVDHLHAAIRRAALRRAITVLLTGGLLFEYWSAPAATATARLTPPPVYRWLAEQPPTVVLELPVPTPNTLWGSETTFQYFSIFHWQPLVNGYSGYPPASYVRLLDSVKAFPSEHTLRQLETRGVGLIILHERLMDEGEFDRLLQVCSNRQWFSAVRLFDDPVLRRSAACRLLRPMRSAETDDSRSPRG
jgi:hypothetical protein